MMAMRVDFINPTRQPIIGWLLLALGLTAIGAACVHYLSHLQQKEMVTQAQLGQSHLAAELKRKLTAAQPAAQPYHLNDRRWQQAVKELTLPWSNTLRALEDAAKPPIFLVIVKSNPATGQLQLEAEAPDFDAALGFVSALQSSSALAHTQMVSHQEATGSKGQPFTRFSVQTSWAIIP